MKPDKIKAWRGTRTQKEAGEAIGRSPRQIRGYESGEYPIDKTVEMACAAEVLGVKHIDQAITLKELIDSTAE